MTIQRAWNTGWLAPQGCYLGPPPFLTPSWSLAVRVREQRSGLSVGNFQKGQTRSLGLCDGSVWSPNPWVVTKETTPFTRGGSFSPSQPEFSQLPGPSSTSPVPFIIALTVWNEGSLFKWAEEKGSLAASHIIKCRVYLSPLESG